MRTLHHWDELGLLSPAERTPAGYRLYGEEEVRRLYRIVALRGLGLTLEQVGAALDDGELRELVRRQIEALDRRMEHDARLRRRLVRMLESDDSSDLLATVEINHRERDVLHARAAGQAGRAPGAARGRGDLAGQT